MITDNMCIHIKQYNATDYLDLLDLLIPYNKKMYVLCTFYVRFFLKTYNLYGIGQYSV